MFVWGIDHGNTHTRVARCRGVKFVSRAVTYNPSSSYKCHCVDEPKAVIFADF
jgi:hypothetical protein